MYLANATQTYGFSLRDDVGVVHLALAIGSVVSAAMPAGLYSYLQKPKLMSIFIEE